MIELYRVSTLVPEVLSLSEAPKVWTSGEAKLNMKDARVRFWLGNLKTASDWIGVFKEPNMCGRGSWLRLTTRSRLWSFQEQEFNLWDQGTEYLDYAANVELTK